MQFAFANQATAEVYPQQYADSLEVKLILVDEPVRMEILNKLAEHYVRNYPQTALNKSRDALSLASKLNDKKYQSRSMRNIAVSLQNLLAEYDSALNYCFEALKLSQSINEQSETIQNLIAIANIYFEVGNYSKSIDFLTRAELLSSSQSEHSSLIEIKILKSKSFLNIDLYNESIEELKRALKICKLHDLEIEEARVRLAMTEHYLAISNENLAFEHVNRALYIFNQSGNPDDISRALNSLANCYSTFYQPEKAIEPLQKSLEIRKYLSDLTGIGECYLLLGVNYNKLNKYQEAISELTDCRYIAESINSKRILRRCYNQFYIAYSNLENLEKASEFRDLYVSITELIFAEENERKIAEQQAKFDIEQKNNELQIQKERLDNKTLQFEKERKYTIALLFIVILLLGGVLYVFYNYKEKKKVNRRLAETNEKIAIQNENLQRLNETKDKFFSIIGHDLKGPLNSLTSFLNLLKNHTSKLSEQEIKNLAEELDKSIKNLYSLLENLLTWARSQTNGIEIKPTNIDLSEIVSKSAELLKNQAENKNIEIKISENKPVQAFADENTIKTVVRNLISNAIKFTHQHGKIVIKLDEWKDGAEVTIQDNGMGMSQEAIDKLFKIGTKYSTPGTDKEKGTGLGLVLCKEFVEKNRGSIHVSSTVGVGSKFTFTLPKN